MFKKLAVAAIAVCLSAAAAQNMPVLWPCGSAANEGGVSSVMCAFNGGTLSVVGTGAMADYHGCPTCDVENNVGPWYNTHRGEITAVIIDSGVTHVGKHAFWDLPNLAAVTIGSDVNTIGEFAFYYLPKLSTVRIGNSVTSIGEGAFAGCTNLSLAYSYNPVPPNFLPDIVCEMCPPEDNCPPCPIGSFMGVYDAVLYVPSAGLTAYNTSGSWEFHFSEIYPLMPTSVRPRSGTAQSRPAAIARVTVRNRTLTIRPSSPEAVSRVRLIDMRGRSAANFTATGPANFSLGNIPAGRYFVEVRDGARIERSAVVVGGGDF